MGITADELIVYGSANMQESDTGTQGGAIDTSTRVIFDSIALANAPAGIVSILSDNSGDTTQTVTITGRNTGGTIVSEALNLAGLTEVNGSQSFERILKIVVSAVHTGTITVQDSSDTKIVDIESGVLTIRRPFYNVSADVAGGSTRNFYEKVFVKNTNATLSLLSATITGGGDGSSVVDFDLENAVDGSNTSTNRVTAPDGSGMLGLPTWNDTVKSVPGTDLAAGSAIGVWMRLQLAAGVLANKTSYSLTISGGTI